MVAPTMAGLNPKPETRNSKPLSPPWSPRLSLLSLSLSLSEPSTLNALNPQCPQPSTLICKSSTLIPKPYPLCRVAIQLVAEGAARLSVGLSLCVSVPRVSGAGSGGVRLPLASLHRQTVRGGGRRRPFGHLECFRFRCMTPPALRCNSTATRELAARVEYTSSTFG